MGLGFAGAGEGVERSPRDGSGRPGNRAAGRAFQSSDRQFRFTHLREQAAQICPGFDKRLIEFDRRVVSLPCGGQVAEAIEDVRQEKARLGGRTGNEDRDDTSRPLRGSSPWYSISIAAASNSSELGMVATVSGGRCRRDRAVSIEIATGDSTCRESPSSVVPAVSKSSSNCPPGSDRSSPRRIKSRFPSTTRGSSASGLATSGICETIRRASVR